MRLWVVLSLAFALLIGGLLCIVWAQAEISRQREYQFNDIYRLASHSTCDAIRAERLVRFLNEVNQSLADEIKNRPIWSRDRPRGAF